MDLPEELSRKLDFSHGKKFRKEILQLFGSSVHHTLATPSRSFFLLVVFRCYTFHLTEDSVAFALASCLGGAPAGFHVQFQSDRHFRFSVANKAVGFHVYSLRRFIGDHFDAYFHLWHDGTPNWEREKRLWELEQEKEWSKVMSKAQKRKAKSDKRVSFASSPMYYRRKPPLERVKSSNVILFGQFQVDLNAHSGDSATPNSQLPVHADRPCSSVHLNFESTCKASEILANVPARQSVITSEFSGSPSGGRVFSNLNCFNCLSPGHLARSCLSPVRCKLCFNYGHVSKWCSTRSKPKILWKPKCQVLEKESNDPVQTDASFLGDSSGPSSSLQDGENPTPNQSTVQPTKLPVSPPPPDIAMANFDVNPIPYIPTCFDLEQWARPARGRIIVSGNPPRAHEQYAIVTMTPAPQPLNLHQLHQAIDDVIDYFEGLMQVHVVSVCPSPLGLCLLEFRSAITRQSMINRSPHIMPDGRELFLVEHDNGINLRATPFMRTCWIMFLCFPLDYQTKGYIEQAVNLFGTVVTWTSNTRCKSRVLVRCSMLHISKVPRSILVCKPAMVGGAGQSWTVPIFILNSSNNEHVPADEDMIPDDGNPHPFPGPQPEHQNDFF